MEMTIIYIVLIGLLIGIIWHILCNLMVVFYQHTTDLYIKKVMEDPYRYVRNEHMCHFMRNMLYLWFVCMFLIISCNGNIHFEKKTKQTEISNVKNK